MHFNLFVCDGDVRMVHVCTSIAVYSFMVETGPGVRVFHELFHARGVLKVCILHMLCHVSGSIPISTRVLGNLFLLSGSSSGDYIPGVSIPKWRFSGGKIVCN